jgi:hypothetical protein
MNEWMFKENLKRMEANLVSPSLSDGSTGSPSSNESMDVQRKVGR